jgi:NAD(P)-dependent dehydrogenase (short-subunit alcohol dehydrogenase family)
LDLGLAGKVALITGGSEGIGRATARTLAREGARVAICARRPEVLEEARQDIKAATGVDALAVPGDVMQAEDVERVVATVTERLGPITVLVNNAGTSAAGRFEAVSDEAWQADIDLKLMGAIRMSRLVVPHMRAAGGGRIVNVTAIAGKHPGAGSLPTSVSRAAGIALTKAMSKELARDRILVNTVCIGLIKSAQIARAAERRFPDLPLDQAWERMGEGVPVGRIGEAEEAADLITFLVSERAGYITGVAINMDGGSSSAT